MALDSIVSGLKKMVTVLFFEDRSGFMELFWKKKTITVQSQYSTPCYNTDLDITWSCCGSLMFLP